MRPRFGGATRVLAAVFAIAGIGAGLSMLSTGDYSGSDSDRLVLLAVANVCIALAVGLFFEFAWAWWASTIISGAVAVLDLTLHADSGWIVWAVVFGAF